MPLVRQDPTLLAYTDAQNRLRDKLGQDVDFMVRVTPTWADGVVLDESGEPFDPTIAPASGGDLRAVTKRVGVIFKKASPLRPGADTRWTQVGEFSGMDLILDLNATDYDDVQEASQVWMDTLRFRIVEWKPSGLGGMRRWLVYGQEL